MFSASTLPTNYVHIMALIKCPECKKEISDKAGACPSCGYSKGGTQKAAPQVIVSKSPGLAAVLSFFIPGLGQIYNGQIGKGISFIILYGISIMLIFTGIGIFTTPIMWLIGIYDAYQGAAHRGKSGAGFGLFIALIIIAVIIAMVVVALNNARDMALKAREQATQSQEPTK